MKHYNYPLVEGRFSWRDAQTLVFQPDTLLQSQHIYGVIIRPDLRDTEGWGNHGETQWLFRVK